MKRSLHYIIQEQTELLSGILLKRSYEISNPVWDIHWHRSNSSSNQLSDYKLRCSKAVDLLKYPMYISWAIVNGYKAETFSRHLYTPNDKPTKRAESYRVFPKYSHWVQTLPDASSATKHFTIAEITREIKLLNNRKPRLWFSYSKSYLEKP